MFDILKFHKTVQSAASQVANTLGAAQFISHGFEEVPGNALRLLAKDAQAREMLYAEFAQILVGIEGLKAELAERVAAAEVVKSEE